MGKDVFALCQFCFLFIADIVWYSPHVLMFLQMVTDLCIKHMPSMACCLEDERVTVCFDDGVEFLKRRNDLFDIIITDAPDPFGM